MRLWNDDIIVMQNSATAMAVPVVRSWCPRGSITYRRRHTVRGNWKTAALLSCSRWLGDTVLGETAGHKMVAIAIEALLRKENVF